MLTKYLSSRQYNYSHFTGHETKTNGAKKFAKGR